MTNFGAALRLFSGIMQRLAVFLLPLAAISMIAVTLAGAFGALPTLQFAAQIGETQYANAGWIAQIGLTGLLVAMCFYLPSAMRMMQLEASHRKFHIGMEDVAHAYALAHQEDRNAAFTMSSEFDAVRERIAFLRRHPDLDTLENDVIEVAAQMSQVSKDLAEVYSDKNVTRAREFLTQRQEEIARFEARVEEAKRVVNELSHWRMRVELEEDVAQSQLAQLRSELAELLPDLGLETGSQTAPAPEPERAQEREVQPDRVVTLSKKRTAR